MLIAIIIAIIIYVISCCCAYKFMQKAYYHKHGWNYEETPKELDIFFVFIPIINTFISVLFVFESWKKDEYRENKIINNFFKPKK